MQRKEKGESKKKEARIGLWLHCVYGEVPESVATGRRDGDENSGHSGAASGLYTEIYSRGRRLAHIHSLIRYEMRQNGKCILGSVPGLTVVVDPAVRNRAGNLWRK